MRLMERPPAQTAFVPGSVADSSVTRISLCRERKNQRDGHDDEDKDTNHGDFESFRTSYANDQLARHVSFDVDYAL